ncbi:fluoride efflux transporter FluC [Parvularcula maris]|uniref:Fluoride-specific ion channel FluC n=1 Tax=Parvularcula maris TaxID=2965077 RepID=A0A9X2RIG8_9PROT|nr:CrcB family protein [Parvularcula maris]
MTFSFAHLLGVAAGGALGASLRYLFLVFLQGGALGIFVLNVAGSLLLGLLLSAVGEKSPALTAFAGTGLLGALTTYSTFSGDLVRLFGQSMQSAVLYGAASLALGVVAFLLGTWLGRLL